MLNFEVEISSGEGGSYRISARSPAGDISGIPVRFPFDELTLDRQLRMVELALLRSAATMRQLIPAEEQPVQQFGRLLFEFAFPPELRAHLSASRQQAAQETTSLRVRLRVGPADLAALPWEFLYDPDRDEYLCLSSPLVRYLDVLEPPSFALASHRGRSSVFPRGRCARWALSAVRYTPADSQRTRWQPRWHVRWALRHATQRRCFWPCQTGSRHLPSAWWWTLSMRPPHPSAWSGSCNPDVWARLATTLGTASYTAADIGWLLSDTTAPDLLTRGEPVDGVTGTVTYRLFHEALAEYLRTVLTSRMSVDMVSRSFATVLVSAVPTRPDGRGRDWTKADQYTRTYLSVHAAAGGVLDDLVCDLSFVAVAEPSRLLQALPAVTSAEGRQVAETLIWASRQLLLFPARERLSYLELAARKSGDSQLADRVSDADPDRPWSVPWACWAAPASGRTIGHHGHYIRGLSVMSLGGRPVVAAADSTAVRLWDPQTASAVEELTEPGLADISAMTTTSTDTGPRIVTGHTDGTIAFWNPVTGSHMARETGQSGWVRVITSLAHDLVVSDGTVTNLTLWRAKRRDSGRQYRDTARSAAARGWPCR